IRLVKVTFKGTLCKLFSKELTARNDKSHTTTGTFFKIINFVITDSSIRMSSIKPHGRHYNPVFHLHFADPERSKQFQIIHLDYLLEKYFSLAHFFKFSANDCKFDSHFFTPNIIMSALPF